MLQVKADDSTKPVEYGCQSLTKAEQVYDRTRYKCPGIILSVLTLSLNLEGTGFTIQKDYADYDLVKSVRDLGYMTARLARLGLHLCKLDFSVVDRAGLKHQATDALFCFQTTGANSQLIDDDLPVAAIETDTFDPTTVGLVNDRQALAQVVKDHSPQQNRAAFKIEGLLHHQTIESYCRHAAKSVGMTKAKNKIEKKDQSSKL